MTPLTGASPKAYLPQIEPLSEEKQKVEVKQRPKNAPKKNEELEEKIQELFDLLKRQEKAIHPQQRQTPQLVRKRGNLSKEQTRVFKSHLPFLWAFYQSDRPLIPLRKTLGSQESKDLSTLNSHGLLVWNKRQNAVALTLQVKAALSKRHFEPPISLCFAAFGKYVEPLLLESLIAQIDFGMFLAQEQIELLATLVQFSLKRITLQNVTCPLGNALKLFFLSSQHPENLTLLNCQTLRFQDLVFLPPRIALTLGETQEMGALHWNALSETFPSFSLQIRQERFSINQLNPNKLLLHAITYYPNKQELFKLALFKKANVNVLCKKEGVLYGKNALHIAAENNNLPLLHLFAEYRGNFTIVDHQGSTPLDRAIAQDLNGSHAEVIDYLTGKI